MLSERVQALLTAAVDGELTPGQRRGVHRLLMRSKSARRLYHRLKADAAALRALPRVAAPADLAERVLLAIAANGAAPRPTAAVVSPAAAPNRAARHLSRWALAASLFLAIGVGSFVVFQQSSSPSGSPAVAARPVTPALPPGPTERLPGDSPRDPDRTPPIAPPPAPGAAQVAPSALANANPPGPNATGPKAAPEPRKPDGDLTAPPRNDVETTMVPRPRLPAVLAIRELDQAPVRQRLLDELNRNDAVHIDLFARDPRGFDRLRAAFQAQGVKVLLDPLVQERFKRGVPTELALYVESLSADDLAQVFQRLSAGGVAFDRLIVGPLMAEDGKELTTLIGVDPTLPIGRSRAPLGVDIRKPLSEDTAAGLGQSLAGAAAARSEAGKPAAAPSERLALVFAYPPAKLPGTSKEVRQFLDARKAHPAAGVPVYLIVRALDR
jgi:hypothetical protein